jgi:putative membrane protein
MVLASLVAFLHFAAAFGVVAALVFEWLTFSRTPTVDEARRLASVDRWYGLSAMVLLVVGFTRAYHFEKGWAFYLHSPFFHAKVGLFVLIGLLSILPTVTFIRWRPALQAQYRNVARCLKLQLILLIPLLVSASLMARGVGLGTT